METGEKWRIIEKYFSNKTCGEYSVERLSEMGNYELFSAYLEWNGIIGYTDDIISVLESITGKEVIA